MSSRKNGVLCLITCSIGFLLSGCNILAWPVYVLFGGQKQKIEAEYRDLENQTVAIIVGGQSGIDFEYPYARTNIALALSQMLMQHLEGVNIASLEKIKKAQNRLDWNSLKFAEMSRLFDCQKILYIDLIRYTLYEENSIHLLRGVIIADVRVYDMHSPQTELPVYDAEVDATFPEGAPQIHSQSVLQAMELRTISEFAQAAAKKFYDHYEQSK